MKKLKMFEGKKLTQMDNRLSNENIAKAIESRYGIDVPEDTIFYGREIPEIYNSYKEYDFNKTVIYSDCYQISNEEYEEVVIVVDDVEFVDINAISTEEYNDIKNDNIGYIKNKLFVNGYENIVMLSDNDCDFSVVAVSDVDNFMNNWSRYPKEIENAKKYSDIYTIDEWVDNNPDIKLIDIEFEKDYGVNR